MTGGPDNGHGEALKTKREDLRGANRRGETTKFPESLVLDSILAERVGTLPRRTLGQIKYGLSKMIGQRQPRNLPQSPNT